MGKAKRERQRAGRQARLAAAAAAQRRASRRRFVIYLGVLVVVVIGVLLLISGGDDEGDDVAAGTSTTPPTTAAGSAGGNSAAGKPCVAVSEPLPTGAPEVPIEVGPPPTQLVTRDLVVGEGATVPAGATVTAHYVGVACTTGVIFDSSYSRGAPIPFSLSGVIPGWQQGIPGMKVGGRRLLGIPAAQAYGTSPPSDKILPDEPLWFVVDVVSVS